MSRVRIPSFAHFLPMTSIEAIILGIIQGLTEFLPVSSSGHLILAQKLLGMENLHDYVVFDLVCHLGTLLAIFFVFYRSIISLFTEQRRLFWQVCLGTLPLFPLVLAIKPIKELFNQPENLGFFFLITAFLLWCGIRFGKAKEEKMPETRPWRDPLVIGLFQAFAIVPGVSRSGSTTAAARLLGWSYEEALRFSFLLAIPAILGGISIELLQLFLKAESALPQIGLVPYAAGFVTSFAVGLGALTWLLRLAAKEKFIYFVWYCLFLGLASLILLR
ncbi:MAG: undecaprenyl-diphosphate phosphatase [Parachlamydia sp.]|nr:undecaprenyl-diphosphate phosphatase [Parachlamydia sp.]